MTVLPGRRGALALSICALPCALCPELRAADPPPDPPADDTRLVVISAKMPEDSPVSPDINAARQRLQSLPGAVNVVEPADLPRGRGAYLEDLLRLQPGVVVQSAQGSEDTKLSIRCSGVQSDNIRGVSVLVDGIPLNQADGEAFLQDLDLQSVQYAEVYRGADALRYGALTLGGAVNLVTVTGRTADPFTTRASFGSFGLFEQQFTSGWSAGRWDVYGSVVNHVLDGYRNHARENYQKAFASLGYQFNPATENRLYFFYGRLDQNNPSGLTKDELHTDPRQTSPESVTQDWSTRWDYVRLMDRFGLRGDGWQLGLALAWNHRQQTQREGYEAGYRLGATRYYSDDYALDLAYENTADVLGGRNRLSVGLIPTFEPESDSSYANPDGHLGALLFTDQTYYFNSPVYLENQHYLTEQLSLLTGFQAVYVRRIFRDRFRSPTLGDQSRHDHFWTFNPKLGLAYERTKGTLAYLNFSRSFQPPSFDESLGVQGGPDGGRIFHDLRSQRAYTLEVGTRGEAGPFDWDVALYRSWVRDELLDQNNAQGEPLGTINAPRTIHQGVEVGLQTEVFRSLLVKGPSLDRSKDGQAGAPAPAKTDRVLLDQAYTLSDFHFDDHPTYGTNRIAGTPVHFYKAELRYEHPRGFYAGINVECSASKYPVDEANSLFADPYALLGCRAGYRTAKGPQVFFEAKNLTNQVYAATVAPLGDARTNDDTAAFNPGNKRAFYGGVSWVW